MTVFKSNKKEGPSSCEYYSTIRFLVTQQTVAPQQEENSSTNRSSIISIGSHIIRLKVV